MKPVVIIVVFTAIKLSQGLQQLGGMVEEEDIRRSKTFFFWKFAPASSRHCHCRVKVWSSGLLLLLLSRPHFIPTFLCAAL